MCFIDFCITATLKKRCVLAHCLVVHALHGASVVAPSCGCKGELQASTSFHYKRESPPAPPIPHSSSPFSSPSLLLLTAALWVSVALCWHSECEPADTWKSTQPHILMYTQHQQKHTHNYMLHKRYINAFSYGRSVGDLPA